MNSLGRSGGIESSKFNFEDYIPFVLVDIVASFLHYSDLLFLDIIVGKNYVARFGEHNVYLEIMYKLKIMFGRNRARTPKALLSSETIAQSLKKFGACVSGSFLFQCLRGQSASYHSTPTIYVPSTAYRNFSVFLKTLDIFIPESLYGKGQVGIDYNLMPLDGAKFHEQIKKKQDCKVREILYDFETKTLHLEQLHKLLLIDRSTLSSNCWTTFRDYFQDQKNFDLTQRMHRVKYFSNNLEDFTHFYISGIYTYFYFLLISNPVQNGSGCTFNASNKKVQVISEQMKSSEFPGIDILDNVSENTVKCFRHISRCTENCLFSQYVDNEHFHETIVTSPLKTKLVHHLILYLSHDLYK